MIRRPRRSVAAALTALVLFAGCALVAIVGVQMLAGQRQLIRYRSVADALHRAHWNGLGVGIAGGVAAALGLILLLAAIVPGKATVLPVRGEGIDSGASRRSLRSTLRAAVGSVDGVTTAKLRLRRRKITAKVWTDCPVTVDLTGAVTSAIDHRLDQIAPAVRPTLRLRVKATRSPS